MNHLQDHDHHQQKEDKISSFLSESSSSEELPKLSPINYFPCLSFIAIARNAKRFAILFIRHSFFLFFFYFPFPSPVFGPTGKRFLSFVPQNACDRYWACFFGHTGKCFVLILFTVISVWEVLV